MEMMKIMQDIRQFCSLHVKRSPKGGISSAQELDLLSRLHLSENPLTPHSLCEKMGISKPLASSLLRTQMGEEKFGLLAGLLCECNRISGEKQQSQADGTDESGGRR